MNHAVVTTFVAGLCVVGIAFCLHSATHRSDAVWILPFCFVLGALSLHSRTFDTHWWMAPVVGLILRLILIGTPPLLSDDAFRYLAEGWALNHGINPFLVAPHDLSGAPTELIGQVNHGTLTSIYPPIALLWFRLLALWPTLASAQLGAALCDLGVLYLLARHRPWASWVFALHPLAILESAQGAHLEPMVILLALAAILTSNRTLGGALQVGAIGAKLLPGTWMVRDILAGSRQYLIGVIIGTMLLGAASMPIIEAGPLAMSSFQKYATQWSFNGFLFPWLAPYLGASARPFLIGVGVLTVLWANYRTTSALWRWVWIGSAFLLLTPTAHPWYGLWVLAPSLAVGRIEWAAGLIFLPGAYAVLTSWDPALQTWNEAWWLWPAVWLPGLLAAAIAHRSSP